MAPVESVILHLLLPVVESLAKREALNVVVAEVPESLLIAVLPETYCQR